MKWIIKIGWVIILFGASLNGVPYSDNGNGTVTDAATGLIWQKCSAGLDTIYCTNIYAKSSSFTWSDAISYCEGLSLGGRKDWRLPNINELRSIVNYTISTSPVIDLPLQVQPNYYWSSTTTSTYSSNAWIIIFGDGYLTAYDKTYKCMVKCVTGP